MARSSGTTTGAFATFAPSALQSLAFTTRRDLPLVESPADVEVAEPGASIAGGGDMAAVMLVSAEPSADETGAPLEQSKPISSEVPPLVVSSSTPSAPALVSAAMSGQTAESTDNSALAPADSPTGATAGVANSTAALLSSCTEAADSVAPGAAPHRATSAANNTAIVAFNAATEVAASASTVPSSTLPAPAEVPTLSLAPCAHATDAAPASPPSTATSLRCTSRGAWTAANCGGAPGENFQNAAFWQNPTFRVRASQRGARHDVAIRMRVRATGACALVDNAAPVFALVIETQLRAAAAGGQSVPMTRICGQASSELGDALDEHEFAFVIPPPPLIGSGAPVSTFNVIVYADEPAALVSAAAEVAANQDASVAPGFELECWSDAPVQLIPIGNTSGASSGGGGAGGGKSSNSRSGGSR